MRELTEPWISLDVRRLVAEYVATRDAYVARRATPPIENEEEAA